MMCKDTKIFVHKCSKMAELVQEIASELGYAC